MSDAWKDREVAQEEAYFKKQNEAALQRLQERKDEDTKRLSPVSGKEMEEIVFHGVVIDRCAESGGIWLDAGELEQILAVAQQQSAPEDKESYFDSFFKFLKKN